MPRSAVRPHLSALAATLALAGLVACGGPAPVARPPAVGTPSPAPVLPPPVLWPLTGKPATGSVDHPAVAVKIENSLAARPQSGLAAADLVWEEVVEGGITRYVAVYHSELPAEIGPVRSVRPMDPAIAAPLRGLFAFSGGQPDFVAAIADAGLQVLSNDAGAAGFHRVDTRSAPHNVYASPSSFLTQADAAHSGPPPRQFDVVGAGEQSSAVLAGRPATAVGLTLSGSSHPSWHWKRSVGAWLRSEDGTPAVDADGTRLHAANVVVLRVDVVNTRYVDPAGNPVPETELVGSGEALVASGGHVLEATWSKRAEGAPVVLTTGSGATVRLAAGPTWVELVPDATGSVTAR
jgi:Protein of unknown function (DUF3048) N-terminal domain/Protein of unknown function (DUF3048) C-terminal domain